MTLTLHGGGGYPTTIVPSPIDRSSVPINPTRIMQYLFIPLSCWRGRARHRRSRHDTRQAHDKHKTEGADLLVPCKISLHRQLHRRRMSNGSSSSSSVEEDFGSYATAVGVIASQFGTLVAVSCFVGNTRNTRERKTQKRIYQFYGFCQESRSLPPSVFDAARARSKRIPPPFPFFCPFF